MESAYICIWGSLFFFFFLQFLIFIFVITIKKEKNITIKRLAKQNSARQYAAWEGKGGKRYDGMHTVHMQHNAHSHETAMQHSEDVTPQLLRCYVAPHLGDNINTMAQRGEEHHSTGLRKIAAIFLQRQTASALSSMYSTLFEHLSSAHRVWFYLTIRAHLAINLIIPNSNGVHLLPLSPVSHFGPQAAPVFAAHLDRRGSSLLPSFTSFPPGGVNRKKQKQTI